MIRDLIIIAASIGLLAYEMCYAYAHGWNGIIIWCLSLAIATGVVFYLESSG